VREVAEALGVQEQTVRKRIDTLVKGGVELPPLVSRKKDIIAEAKAALAAALGSEEEVF
jgi:DNA-binding MarR family transcriptional regulator